MVTLLATFSGFGLMEASHSVWTEALPEKDVFFFQIVNLYEVCMGTLLPKHLEITSSLEANSVRKRLGHHNTSCRNH